MPVIDLGKVVGDPGASMRFRGEWNGGSEYFNNESYIDTVTHHGSLWVCKQTNTGQEPIEGDYWGIGAYGTETGFDATITIPASGWTGSEPPFAQTVTVSGMTYEKAVVYAVQSDGASPTDKEKAEYAKITGISQNVNSITFYASEKPSTDIVIRAFNGAGTEDAADLSVIAAPFDSGKDYVEGEHCMNEGQMWKFDDAKSSGAWDPSKVTSTTVAKELEAHEAAISALNSSSYSEITFINDASVFQNENKIIKTGNVVFLSVGITLPTSLSPWVGNDVGTVPEGFWPRYAMSMSVNTRSNIWCIVTINTDGRITIQPFGTPAENATFIIQMSWSTK